MFSSIERRLWWLREPQDLPAQSFGGAHMGRVCIRVFIGVSVRAFCVVLLFFL